MKALPASLSDSGFAQPQYLSTNQQGKGNVWVCSSEPVLKTSHGTPRSSWFFTTSMFPIASLQKTPSEFNNKQKHTKPWNAIQVIDNT